ncbi:photosystem reaction center subunit H [Amycolatopsis antarctica]|uniref:Photosystem reaction center subunit H n=1 Tax=Amycolatopsis antarctica TaxID=1854586 RepID=A0A263CY84_9PSEU|nr:PRC-barrel domain-containing protein [Amycolatopsis antarctica]OZM71114.1 photosystem reaction center subunit H [Amycolatopsis antarctica]
MFVAENISDWCGLTVVDADGDKIGEMDSIYFDTASDRPAFATVKIGIIGRHRLVFVPLDGATVSPKQVRVPVGKSQAKDSPAMDTDGELLATEEAAIFDHYGLVYHPGVSGERRLARR